MDASALKVADTGTIHVKNAAGEPLYDGENPVRVVLHSPGSRAFSVLANRQNVRATKRYNDSEGKLASVSADESRAETAADLAAVTIRFDGLTYGDKTGSELFEAVYADPALGFIVVQVTKALKDWGTFQGKSQPA